MSSGLDIERLQSDASGGPLYLKLRQAIEDAIVSGRLKHGDALPAERDMAEEAAVSRVTVRKAVDDLVLSGLLVRRHGSGTFVMQPMARMQQPLTRLTSFTEDMRRRGMVPGSRWLERGLMPPNDEEVMALGLSPSSMVARLARLRLADGNPLALERTSLPGDILPDPTMMDGSLYETLEQRGIRPVRAIQRISACILTNEETVLLGVPTGSAALSVQHLAYLDTGRVIEVTRALYRSDAYDLVAELTIDSRNRSQTDN